MEKLFAGPNSTLDAVGRYGAVACFVVAAFLLWRRNWLAAGVFALAGLFFLNAPK